MSEKKVVRRSIGITLGIICIVLAVGVVGAFAYYMQMINDKNNMISSLNSQIASLDSQIAVKNSTISSLDSEVLDLENQLARAVQMFELQSFTRSTVWVSNQTVTQSAGILYYSPNWTFSAGSVGFVLVTIAAPNETFYQGPLLVIEVHYSANGVQHDYRTAGFDYTSGTGFFPVLPSSNIRVEIENRDYAHDQTYTITITYYY